MFGYVKLSACPEYAEFGNISETELKLLGNKVWKVPKKNWCLCPEVEVQKLADKESKKDKEGWGIKYSQPLCSYFSFCKGVNKK